MSFLKYTRETGDSQSSLHFHRADVDGAPFRGSVPLLREEEYQQYVERVHDVHVRLFDIADETDRRDLQEVLDRTGNKWYEILDYEKKWVVRKDAITIMVYLVWSIPHMQFSAGKLQAESGIPLAVPEDSFEIMGE